MQEAEAKEFEETLIKLSHKTKGKIWLNEFTAKDKINLLDLLTNNEKILIKIHEALFPPNTFEQYHHPAVKEPTESIFNNGTQQDVENYLITQLEEEGKQTELPDIKPVEYWRNNIIRNQWTK